MIEDCCVATLWYTRRLEGSKDLQARVRIKLGYVIALWSSIALHQAHH